MWDFTYRRVKLENSRIESISERPCLVDHTFTEILVLSDRVATNDEASLGVPCGCCQGQSINQLRHGELGQLGR